MKKTKTQKQPTAGQSAPIRVSIPAMAVRTVEEAEQAKEALEQLRRKLCSFTEREHKRKEAPAVKMLNRHLAAGEVLYCEYTDKSRFVCDKSNPNIFRSKPNGGIVLCGMYDDPKRYYTIDRVYNLRLDVPPELLYERR